MGTTEQISSIDYRKFSERKPYRTIERDEDIEGCASQERVARIVKQMVKKLGHPESVMFYRKCAWHMSEDEIFSRIESAIEGHRNGKIRNSHAYFIWSAHKLLLKRKS